MTALLVDGNAIAHDLGVKITESVKNMVQPPIMGVVMVGEDPVTQSYVERKRHFAQQVGITFVERYIPSDVTQERLEQEITDFIAQVNGIVVQLPLPKHIDTDRILSLIPSDKDVDVLRPDGKTEGVRGPVAAAVLEVLRRYSIDIQEANCVVVGSGNLVGKPVARMLKSQGGEVVVLDKNTPQDQQTKALEQADIVVSGAGSVSVITPERVREGVVLIDAGTSSDSGEVRGDIDPSCADKGSLFSSTPGGIGPITVAKLFENLITLRTFD